MSVGSAAEVPGAGSSPCRAEAKAAKAEAAVGEAVPVELRGFGPAGAAWTFPSDASTDEVELTPAPPAPGGPAAVSPPDPAAAQYIARFFALGEARLPPLPVTCKLADGSVHEAQTEALTVRLRSVLPKDPSEQQLADIRPPLALTVGRAFWVALAVALLLLGGVGLLAWRRWRRGREGPAAPALPEVAPDVEAREALARLLQEGPLMRGDLRGHYIALTAIAKRYLERRLEAPVLEMTSSETVAFLRGHEQGQRCLKVIHELVTAADQVKFARGIAFAEEGRRHAAAVGEAITGLEAALRPRQEPAERKVA